MSTNYRVPDRELFIDKYDVLRRRGKRYRAGEKFGMHLWKPA